MRRRDFMALRPGAVAVPHRALAQPASRIPKIGWLVFGGAKLGPVDSPAFAELEQRGLIDGKTLEIDFRHANGDQNRINDLARELVAGKPDVLFGIGSEIIKAMFDQTREIPIVGGISENPVRAGFSAGLARPDKNFTGVTFLTDEMAGKRLELLKEVFPAAKRVGMIWNPQHLDDEIAFARRAAQQLGVELLSFEVQDVPGLVHGLSAAVAAGADSLFVIPSRLTSVRAAQIGAFGREHKLPVVSAWREFAEADCLLSYGPNRRAQAETMAAYMERITQGAKPWDLPIQTPTKFEMLVNMKTAKAIGIPVPASTLLRADEVIE